MWRPLAPVALLAKSRAAEGSPRPTPTKVIQIEAQPLPSVRYRSVPAACALAPAWALLDHDYCHPAAAAASPGEHGKRWNVKQQPNITIRTVTELHPTTTTPPPHGPTTPPETTKPTMGTKQQQQPESAPWKEVQLAPLPDRAAAGSSVLETPDASPARQEKEASDEGEVRQRSPGPEQVVRSHHHHRRSRNTATTATTTRSFPEGRKRGRSRRRPVRRSPSSSESDSSSPSRSRSRSPPTKR